MSAPSIHHEAPATCLRCSYPVETNVSIFKILDHLSDMVQLAGYSVDRLHLQRESPSVVSSAAAVPQTLADRDHIQSDQQQQHQQHQQELLSVTLSLRRSGVTVQLGKRARSAVESTDQHNQPSKRMVMTNSCRLCASSCCSTNSLCKANACNHLHHHDNEETSAPSPSSPIHQPCTRPNQQVHQHSRGSQPPQNVDQHRPCSQTHVATKQSHSQLESGSPVGLGSNSNTNLQNSNHKNHQRRHHVHRNCSQAQNVNTAQKCQHGHSKSHHHHHHHTKCHVHRRARSQPPPPPVPPPLPAPPPLPNLASTETVSQPVNAQSAIALDLTKPPQTQSQVRNSQTAAQKTKSGERQQVDQSHLQNRPQQQQETQQLLQQQTTDQAPQPLQPPKQVQSQSQPQSQPQLQPVLQVQVQQPLPLQTQPLQVQQQPKAPQQQSHQDPQQERQQLQKTPQPNKPQRADIRGSPEQQAHPQTQVQSLTQVQVQVQSAGHSTQLVQLPAQTQPQPQTQVEVQLPTTAQIAQTGSTPSPADHGIPDVIMITEDITGNQALDEAVHAANIGSISPATASATLTAAAALVGKGAAERWISGNTSTPGPIQVSDSSVLVGATTPAEAGSGNDPESATATPSVELAPNNETTIGNVITEAASQEDLEIEKNSKGQQEGAGSVVINLDTRQVTPSRRRSSSSKSTAVTVPPRPPPDLTCRLCSKLFETELELRRHEFIDHKDERLVTRTAEGRYYCLMHSCTQTFVRRHVMERHFKTVHLMVRDFPCEKCDRAFADSSTREAHLSAVHEKRKPWVCTQCSSSFTQSSSLGKHIRRFHSGTVAANAACDDNESMPPK